MKVSVSHISCIAFWAPPTVESAKALTQAPLHFLLPNDYKLTDNTTCELQQYSKNGNVAKLEAQFTSTIIDGSMETKSGEYISVHPIVGDEAAAKKWLSTNSTGQFIVANAIGYAFIGSLVEID